MDPYPLLLGVATKLEAGRSRWLVMLGRIWVQVRSLQRQLSESSLFKVALSAGDKCHEWFELLK